MVDPVGSRTTPDSKAVARVSRVVGTKPPATEAKASAAAVSSPGAVARELAADIPVDAERVAAIKAAVAAGRFPISPAKIADRLIALKMQWETTDAP